MTAFEPSRTAAETAQVMPRSLNEPVGFAPSSFSHTSAPTRSDRRGAGTSGVERGHDQAGAVLDQLLAAQVERPIEPGQERLGQAAGQHQRGQLDERVGLIGEPIEATRLLRHQPGEHANGGEAPAGQRLGAHRLDEQHASAARVLGEEVDERGNRRAGLGSGVLWCRGDGAQNIGGRVAGDLVEHGQEELVEVLEALVEVARREIRLCADGSDRRGRPAVGAEQLESGLDQGGAATGDSHRRLDAAVATCGCSAAAHFVYSDNSRWQIGFL